MESLKRLSILFLTIIYLFLHTSCDSGQTPMGRVCTDELRIINIKALSADQQPMMLTQITVTNVETNKVVEICDDVLGHCERNMPVGYPENGSYTIFHDGLRDEISGEKSKILVEGSNNEISFQQEFVIGDDGCHVYKEASPDTVFVEID